MSPDGILPKKARCGKGYVTVKIETVYSPALQLTRYRIEATGSRAALEDVGDCHIIIPLKMLKEHVDSDDIRTTDVQIAVDGNNLGITRPAVPPNATIAENRAQHQQNTQQSNVGGDDEQDEDVDDDDSELEAGPAVDDEEVDSYDLTTKDIEFILASLCESLRAQAGRTPLQCDGLDDPPNIDDIVDRFCCVIGDVFHAMDRAKVPIRHEAKKSYFVALREAFLVWDQDMLKDLERRMCDDGMTNEKSKDARYYNSSLFTGCVSRRVPPPRFLYWRVRAVFAV